MGSATLTQYLLRVQNNDQISHIRVHLTEDDFTKLNKTLSAYGAPSCKLDIMPHYFTEEDFKKLVPRGSC